MIKQHPRPVRAMTHGRAEAGMRVHSAWVAAAVVGIIALVLVSLFVGEPTPRALLALASIVPVLYVTAQLSKVFQRQLAQERRRFSKLRLVTDDFILSVRNLNRLAVLAREPGAPEDTQGMMEQVTQRMRETIDRIVDAAGQEDKPTSEGDASR
jgi:hypothetical protein